MNTDRLAKVRGGQGGTRAFTLIELLVIMALMAMMLSIGHSNFRSD
jgi:prepilin-type N-terminal cleavage/methylation domain-containing protein